MNTTTPQGFAKVNTIGNTRRATAAAMRPDTPRANAMRRAKAKTIGTNLVGVTAAMGSTVASGGCAKQKEGYVTLPLRGT
eukprot:9371601-Pyramimonas_sp.AAC.2